MTGFRCPGLYRLFSITSNLWITAGSLRFRSVLWLRPGFIPECSHRFGRLGKPDGESLAPFSGKDRPVLSKQETVVQKKNHSSVRIGSDHPSSRLHDFIHSRIQVGIIKSAHSFFIKILL